MMAFVNLITEPMFRVFLLIVISFVAGISTNNCTFDVKLEQGLVNDGFHRTIKYSVVFNRNVNRHLYENCIIGLDQMLPEGVFSNPDELYDLRRLHQLSAIPINRVNVELSAEESQPTRVFIISKLIDGRASTWLPVHARYHRAKRGGGYAANEIIPPNVFLRCQDQRLEQCKKAPNTMTFLCNSNSREKCTWKFIPRTVVSEPLVFSVPVGNTSAYYLVTTVTICVVVGTSLQLLQTLHDYITSKGSL